MKTITEGAQVVGGRGAGRPSVVNQGDPHGPRESRVGVRAFVVAMKGRNGPGAKGRREVDS